MRSALPLAGLVALVWAAPAAACPFCSAQGTSLSGEVAQSDFIVLGTMTNARRDPTGVDFTKGTTDLVIESVVKPHEFLAGKKVLPIPKYIPADPKQPDTKFLVFCNLYTRPSDLAAAAVVSTLGLAKYDFVQVDAVRGDPVQPGSKVVDYLTGAFAVRGKDSVARLKYFFDYLDAGDLVISTDAMNEFALTDYPDVRKAAAGLPADRLRKWLLDPSTPAAKIGLYGLLLGHNGKPEDAATLRKLLDGADARYSSGRDGLIAGYTLLDPAAGHAYMMSQITAPAADFQARYAPLKALRFFWEYRPDVLDRTKVLAGVKALVEQPDMADLPIEDLRKWKAWDQTDFVLSFLARPDHAKVAITRRAVLRFCLAAPVEQKAAKEYVQRVRAEDPERVKFVEQTLEDEKPVPASDPNVPAAKTGAGK